MKRLPRRAALATVGAGALAIGAAALIPVTAHKVAPLLTELTVLTLGAVLFIVTVSTALGFGLCRVHQLHLDDIAQSDRFATIDQGGLTEIYRAKPLADEAGPGTVAA